MLGEILSFAFWMKKEGYKGSTARACVRVLKSVARRANLLEPESAKAYLANAKVSDGRKAVIAQHLARFYAYKRIPFDKPRYVAVDTLPFIPLESEIDQLISGVGKKTAAYLQLVKETGARAGEAWNLRWIDINNEAGTIMITPEKRSRARQFRGSGSLIVMLTRLPHQFEFVFRNPDVDPTESLEDFSRNFSMQRRRIAEKLQNPRILRISFKTLRHWKATTEYHRTKDILHVMQMLGHKNIQNTLVYTHLVEFHNDEFVCKTARTVDEARALVENGFDYVSEIDGVQLFRKRK
jgi:integrase